MEFRKCVQIDVYNCYLDKHLISGRIRWLKLREEINVFLGSMDDLNIFPQYTHVSATCISALQIKVVKKQIIGLRSFQPVSIQTWSETGVWSAHFIVSAFSCYDALYCKLKFFLYGRNLTYLHWTEGGVKILLQSTSEKIPVWGENRFSINMICDDATSTLKWLFFLHLVSDTRMSLA